MSEYLKDCFFRPPSGGNARGVPTVNIMAPQGMDRYAPQGGLAEGYPIEEGAKSGPGSQTPLRTSFEAGIRSAGEQLNYAGRVGQPDQRNYRRTSYYRADQNNYPNELLNEEASAERAGKMGSTPQNVPVRLVTPEYQPPQVTGRRSDGRPQRGG